MKKTTTQRFIWWWIAAIAMFVTMFIGVLWRIKTGEPAEWLTGWVPRVMVFAFGCYSAWTAYCIMDKWYQCIPLMLLMSMFPVLGGWVAAHIVALSLF